MRFALLCLCLPLIGCVTTSYDFTNALTCAEVANNRFVPAAQRSQAVLVLFQNHVRPGMTLGELAKLLCRPNWLEVREAHVWSVADVKSESTSDNIVYFFAFPNVHAGGCEVVLRVPGYVNRDSFLRLMSGKSVPQVVEDAKIVAVEVHDADAVFEAMLRTAVEDMGIRAMFESLEADANDEDTYVRKRR